MPNNSRAAANSAAHRYYPLLTDQCTVASTAWEIVIDSLRCLKIVAFLAIEGAIAPALSNNRSLGF